MSKKLDLVQTFFIYKIWGRNGQTDVSARDMTRATHWFLVDNSMVNRTSSINLFIGALIQFP